MTFFSSIQPVLADIQWLTVPIMVLFLLSGVILILVVLVQATKGGGLAGAFGMGGDTTVLGTRAGTFLGKVTAVVAAVFLLLALIYAFIMQAPYKENLKPTTKKTPANAPENPVQPPEHGNPLGS